ncbi:MAG: 2-oxoglutarate and iron-dependent oxygenase domain-containing protein [Caulobacteraceae bacterium]|nr:2-oxoglutarate and iron-dependent oxygenase domain-containing protein [Caulobacteraceae bacterium]
MTSPSAAPAPIFADTAVPVIDISPYFSGDPAQKRAVARQIDEACRAIGFLVISGHGVPTELIERAGRLARAFFDLPLSVKMKYVADNRGYAPMFASALAYTIGDDASPPDFRELLTVGQHSIDEADPYFSSPEGRRVFPPNVYPDEIAGLRETLDAYYDAMTELATALMRLFALALDLDEHWFDDKIDKHMTNLCLSNYPDQPDGAAQEQLRAGAHTDWGSLTILKAEDKPGGLEVRTAAGAWEPAPVVPGAFIINIGDLMAQWTNDQWVSTMHRVVNPPPDKAVGSRRQSLIFFHQPNYDALVECLASCVGQGAKYAPTTSGEHLRMKMEMSRVASA